MVKHSHQPLQSAWWALQDSDGSWYLYWRRPLSANDSTPIIEVQGMSPDGMSLQGNVTEVLRPSQFWEFHNDTVGVVEAPAVQRCYSNTRYCLFYSGSPCCTYGEFYAVGLATATSPYGPFTKWPTNPILGRNQGIAGPGGIGFARPSAVQTYAMYTAWNNLTYEYRGLNMDLMQLNPVNTSVPVGFIDPSVGKLVCQ